MPSEIAGIVVVALIIGAVQVLKGFGVKGKWAPVAAICVGLLVFAGQQLAKMIPGFEPWYDVVMWGITAGLMASGLYSGSRSLGEGGADGKAS